MFLCKILWFCKTRLLKPFLRHVWSEDVSLCLRFCLKWFYFLLFLLLKTHLLPRHVLYMMPRHHFYSEPWGYSRQNHGCACGASKFHSFYTNFLPNYPPISIPFSIEKHQILPKLGGFFY